MTDRQLIALATGDGDAATRVHAAACRDCAARLAALERDLSVLRVALRDAPASAPARHRRWLPATAAGAAAGAAVLLFMLMPARTATPADVASSAPATELGDSLVRALFADAGLDLEEASTDDRTVAAALNGGSVCAGGYGDDCSGELLLAGYD